MIAADERPCQGTQMQMNTRRRFWPILMSLVAAWAIIPAGHAYIEAPYSLGRIVNESKVIVLLRVEKVDNENNRIIYSTVRDIKKW